MAKVKIQGHASGTGVLTVTAPNTSTDRTITLPDATGTLALTTGDDDKLPLTGGTLTGQLNIIQSTSGTGSSAVKELIYNEGAGDAALQLALSGSTDWYIGADNTDNSLKLGQASWDSSPYLTINTDGYVVQNNLPHMFFDGGDNYNTRTIGNGHVFFNTAQSSQAAIDHSGSGTLTGQASNGITYASGTGRFTVPVAGRYYISAHFKYAETTDQVVGIAIHTNGNHAVAYSSKYWTEHNSIEISGCANLAANDYIDFRHNSGGDRDFYMADTHCGGEIFLIG